eukprot:TRINITY_DN27564_c0_g1_i1.p1 TRINITY_DN27564_c0_g1~~TRINITY_DN27564_c0_g1_i1.p1  ORF type:complete len:200 (-),score=22.45 TRINITY_DN27564_c0_g1_i1:133-732(-)
MKKKPTQPATPISSDTLPRHPKCNKISIFRGDITTLATTAIVNAANSSLINTSLGGHDVDAAIHRAAGPTELLSACKELGGCPVGSCKMTKGFALPAPYIIHAVGPVGCKTKEAPQQLSSCYVSALDLAAQNGFESVAFPCISCGVFGFPLSKAVPLVVETVLGWLQKNDTASVKLVVFCVWKETEEVMYRNTLTKALH